MGPGNVGITTVHHDDRCNSPFCISSSVDVWSLGLISNTQLISNRNAGSAFSYFDSLPCLATQCRKFATAGVTLLNTARMFFQVLIIRLDKRPTLDGVDPVQSY